MEIYYIFLAITLVFFIVMSVKKMLSKKTREKTCAICIAVFSTWAYLLISHYFNNSGNLILISLLMGMSLLGIYYILESKIKKELTVFRLPFLMTLVLFSYFIITLENIIKEIYFIASLWIIFSFIYVYRNSKFKNIAKKIVECCKKW